LSAGLNIFIVIIGRVGALTGFAFLGGLKLDAISIRGASGNGGGAEIADILALVNSRIAPTKSRATNGSGMNGGIGLWAGLGLLRAVLRVFFMVVDKKIW
jgi:hypothetical protein